MRTTILHGGDCSRFCGATRAARRLERARADPAPARARPGIPDIYQGSELWNQSLVDPDNRRPVDFAARRQALSALIRERASDATLLCRRLLESYERW